MTDYLSPYVLGLDDTHLVEMPALHCRVHAAVAPALSTLVVKAQDYGYEVRVASSYRNFERQLAIWNGKACGVRPILNDQGAPIDITTLTPRETVFAILRWSALPGASRHHWGTDVDIYDAAAVSADYCLQLTVAETEGDGPFAPFHQWLSSELMDSSNGFFRPYAHDRGGVAPEPWHLSYGPVAQLFSEALSEELLREHLVHTEIAFKEVILENLSEIFHRFVRIDNSDSYEKNYGA